MCVTRSVVFFFNDTATTEIYTLSLHDALPIFLRLVDVAAVAEVDGGAVLVEEPHKPLTLPLAGWSCPRRTTTRPARSEEHTSELQSRQYLVCRLLLEKKTPF